MWQLAAICNSGARLAWTPSSITSAVQSPFITKLSFPGGLSNISGRSGNWIDQLQGDPASSGSGGFGWQDLCPEGSLLSGYQGWATTINSSAEGKGANRCVAAGLRLQCNGSFPNGEKAAELPGSENLVSPRLDC
jgi:hypothetical protein